jgi:hypothetical protein
VTENECSIDVAKTSGLQPDYTFHVTNAGQFPHDLTIDGPGVETRRHPPSREGRRT